MKYLLNINIYITFLFFKTFFKIRIIYNYIIEKNYRNEKN